MSPPDWERVKTLAADALELDPSQREEYVQAQAGGEHWLREEVVRLLGMLSDPPPAALGTGAFAEALKHIPEQQQPALTPGRILCNRFVVKEFIAAGGMGEVYAAWDDELSVSVALKTIQGQVGQDALRRFRREVLRARQIPHRNVCRVYDLFQDGRGPAIHFLTMELLHGLTLQQHLAESGPLSSSDAIAVLTQIAEGLAAAHAHGIIHRDLKPGNIILTRDASGIRAVITDFGLAIAMAEGSDLGVSFKSGTLPYMAPEQVAQGSVSPATDVYAYGVLAKNMLSSAALQQRVPGRRFRWEQIIVRCTDPDSGHRFASGVALRDALTAVSPGRQAIHVMGAVFTTAMAIAAGWYTLRDSALHTDESVRLTYQGGLSAAGAISADGKMAAYASDEAQEGNLDIWARNMETGSSRRLTFDPAEELYPTVSPDNAWVAYRSERQGGGIYAAPSSGGAERLVVRDGRDPAFSPDGQWLAFWTGEPDNLSVSGSRVFILRFPSGEPRPVHPEFADARNPAWSSDGKRLMFLGVREKGAAPDAASEWWVTDLSSSETVQQTQLQASLLAHKLTLHKGVLTWRDHVIFSATQGDTTNIWYAKLHDGVATGGKVARLLQSTESQLIPSVSRDGRLLYSTLQSQIGTWRLNLTDRTRPPELVTSSAGNDTFPSLSADGRKLAFRRRISGYRNVWWKDLQTGKELALTTSGSEKVQPVISPHGDAAAWSEASGASHSAFMVRFSDRSTSPICRNCGDVQSWTPDGKHVLVATGQDGIVTRIGLDSHDRQVVLDDRKHIVDSVRYSPDGSWLAFVGKDHATTRVYLALAGTQAPPDRCIPISEAQDWSDAPAWSHDGARVFFRSNRDGFFCVWSVAISGPAHGQKPLMEAVQHFHSYRSHLDSVPRTAFAIATSSQYLYLTSANIRGSVWASQIRSQ